MSFSVKNKTAIVTGASNGIGLAIARQFALAGASVMLADKNEDDLIRQSEKLQEDAPDGVELNLRYFAGDLRQTLTQANLLSASVDAFEHIDILVNSARLVLPSDALEPKGDNFDALFKQNVLANLRLSQLLAKRFIKQARDDSDISSECIGGIINLSSIAASLTHEDLMAYSVSCAALNQMTRALAVSLAGHRIRVNAIAIGSVESANLNRLLSGDDDLRAKMTESTPLGRIAEASEVAEAAQFLASSSASFITGQILTVDGGRTLLDSLKTTF